MLTGTQIICATVDAQELVEALVEEKIYARLNANIALRVDADEYVLRKFKSLAAELGYRIEPITPHAVLKQELVESLSGRDEPSAELVEMRERVK